MDRRPVLLEWWDAHSPTPTGTWCRLDDLERGPCVVDSCGFVIPGYKAGHITIVQSMEGEHVDAPLCVPVGMVHRFTDLLTGATLPVEP